MRESKQQKGPVQPRTFRRCICPIAGTGSSTVGKNDGRRTTAQPRDETDCRALLLLSANNVIHGRNLKWSGERKIGLSDSSAQKTRFSPSGNWIGTNVAGGPYFADQVRRGQRAALRGAGTGYRRQVGALPARISGARNLRGGTRYQCSREWAIASGPLISADTGAPPGLHKSQTTLCRIFWTT